MPQWIFVRVIYVIDKTSKWIKLSKHTTKEGDVFVIHSSKENKMANKKDRTAKQREETTHAKVDEQDAYTTLFNNRNHFFSQSYKVLSYFSYLIINFICFHRVRWFQVFQSNTSKLSSILWFQVFHVTNNKVSKSKVGDCSWGRPEGFLFNSYYTAV